MRSVRSRRPIGQSRTVTPGSRGRVDSDGTLLVPVRIRVPIPDLSESAGCPAGPGPGRLRRLPIGKQGLRMIGSSRRAGRRPRRPRPRRY